MPRNYEVPPLVEALCEFRFKGSEPWDWTVPGRLYERIGERFPIKKHRVDLQLTVPSENEVARQQFLTTIQFFSRDETKLVQVAPDTLTINHTPVYPGWDLFKQVVLAELDEYLRLVQPESLTSVGLRYINRLRLDPPGEIDLDAYFLAVPRLPETIPQIFQRFVFQVEVPYEDVMGALRVVFGTVDEDHQTFTLDLGMYRALDSPLSIESIPEWLDAAHGCVEAAFEASFTEKTHREVFKEIV